MNDSSFPRNSVLALALTTTLLCGCDLLGDASESNLQGAYEANRFEAVVADHRHDVLEAGGFFRVELFADHRADGEFYVPDSVPGAGEPGEEQSVVSFKGTYSLSGDTIRFEHDADTFVRDATWFVRDGVLMTNEYFAWQDVRVQVEASKEPQIQIRR